MRYTPFHLSTFYFHKTSFPWETTFLYPSLSQLRWQLSPLWGSRGNLINCPVAEGAFGNLSPAGRQWVQAAWRCTVSYTHLGLGLKQLQPKPWDLAPQKYIVGETVECKVVRLASFGAFVELEPTIDGLIHISQIAPRRVEKVEDELRVGDVVTAKILEVNPEKKRISLSIRALMDEPAKEQPKEEENEREENFKVVIPPIEENTVSLADFFPKQEENEE